MVLNGFINRIRIKMDGKKEIVENKLSSLKYNKHMN